MLFCVMPLSVMPICLIPVCVMPFCVMPLCVMPLCVLPLCVLPFSAMPFSAWYLYDSGFFSISSSYCGLSFANFDSVYFRFDLTLFSFRLLNFVIDIPSYVTMLIFQILTITVFQVKNGSTMSLLCCYCFFKAKNLRVGRTTLNREKKRMAWDVFTGTW